MQKISYTAPLDAAFSGTRRILFLPFDLGKWFALGFSAWLATLGAGLLNVPGKFGDHRTTDAGAGFFQLFHAYLPMIIFAAVFGAIFGFAIIVILSWVNARGQFMFLDNVVGNRMLVTQPWTQYRAQGNSLFCWQLVFNLILLAFAFMLLGAGVVAAWPSIRSESFDAHAVAVCFTVMPLLLALGIGTAYVHVFLVDFVVPLMMKYQLSAVAGWRTFGMLFNRHKGTFLLYGLMRFVIATCAGTAVAFACLITCCCGFVLLAIPYVNAVFLLPITVFTRLYSLEFLKQFGPEFDVTAPEPPPLPAMAATN